MRNRTKISSRISIPESLVDATATSWTDLADEGAQVRVRDGLLAS